MAKQIINVGATTNDRTGDSIRVAFQKVNSNFTELYTVGFKGWTFVSADYAALNGDRIIANTSAGPFTITLPSNPEQGYFVEIADGWNFAINNLTLVSFHPVEGYEQDILINIQGLSLEFVYVDTSWQILTTLGVKGDKGEPGEGIVSGSTYNVNINADDSTLLIDSSGGGTFNLDGTVRGHIVPDVDDVYDLGSVTKQWRSLYVSSDTIYIGGTALSVDGNGNLLVEGELINVGALDYSEIINKPTLSTVATSGSYNDLLDKPNLAGTYQFFVAADDSTQRLISSDNVVKFIGAGSVTTSSDSNGVITITGDKNISSDTDVSISINLQDSTKHIWRFGEDGDLTLPGGAQIETSISGDVQITAGNDGASTYGNFVIETENPVQLNQWVFGTDGGLTTPGAVTVGGILKIEDGVHEKFQAKADATGTVTHDCSLGHVFYHTSPDANWTANFINLNLSSGYATAVTLVVVQGGTGYYPSAVEIEGSAQTLNWQGNTTPTPSTNRTDVVTFSILNNSGTYTVLGQLTGF